MKWNRAVQVQSLNELAVHYTQELRQDSSRCQVVNMQVNQH